MKNKILCTICARGNSKGLKNKNIKKINGSPLLKYTIDHALKSKIFDNIVLSSDSKRIIQLARDLGLKDIINRPKKLATDQSGKLDVVKHALRVIEKRYAIKYDVIIDLDVTSPLRIVSDIKKAYNLFLNNNSNILISATPSKKNPFFNQVIQKNNSIKLVQSKIKYLRRQDAPNVYDLNASIYIYKRETLLNTNTIFTKDSSLYIMPEERSVDIDNINDFNYVEYLMKRKK